MVTFFICDSRTGVVEGTQQTYSDQIPTPPDGKLAIALSHDKSRQLLTRWDRRYVYVASSRIILEQDSGGAFTRRRTWPLS